MAINSDAFAQRAVRTLHVRLMRYLLRRLGSADDASDLAQEVYLRLLNADPRAVRSPLHYLLSCAATVLADFYKKGRRELVEFDEATFERTHSDSERNSQDDSVEVSDRERDVVSAVRLLSRVHSEVVVRRAVHGDSYASIARRLGLAEETTRIYYFKAAARVRAAIRDSQGEQRK
jgi:RNA polymerase sigma-70 factor (ECF subfamily)